MRARALALLMAAGLLPGCAPSPAEGPTDPTELVSTAAGMVAVSAAAGPSRAENGRAWGFSHDAVGAALAASNIGARITGAAGIDVAVATIAEQCWGDLAQARRFLGPAAMSASTMDRPELIASAMWFRVLSGDPYGDQVAVSLLADTAQARAAGGFSRLDAVLRWTGADWQLRVPLSRPVIHPNAVGYLLLAPSGGAP